MSDVRRLRQHTGKWELRIYGAASVATLILVVEQIVTRGHL